MRALVKLRLPRGETVVLGHGDLIGRLSTAALMVDDPRISEAHAMVSLRRDELALLSLRRWFSVDGKPLSEVVLTPGLVVELAPGLPVVVEDVLRPLRVVALQSPSLGTRVLPSVVSLYAGPPLTLAPRFEPEAEVHLWWGGAEWRLRRRGGETTTLAEGDVVRVGAEDARVVSVPSQAASAPSTHVEGFRSPLRIVTMFHGVELHRRDRPPVTLGGVGARILSELVAFAGPTDWRMIATEVWGQSDDPGELRHRWDVSLARLRRRLREEGIRADLLKSDGSGFVSLGLYPEDVVEDRS